MTSHRNSALREIRSKSDAQIERETAWTWARRAIASMEQFQKTQDFSWVLRSETFKHEALEHAATVNDYGKTVKMIQTAIDRGRK